MRMQDFLGAMRINRYRSSSYHHRTRDFRGRSDSLAAAQPRDHAFLLRSDRTDPVNLYIAAATAGMPALQQFPRTVLRIAKREEGNR